MYKVCRQKVTTFLLYLTYFLVCFYFAYQWYSKGYLKVYDIFFDTDPSANLSSLAHGWGRHALSHAFLELFSIPIRIITKIVAFWGSLSDEIIFREYLALSICPFFSTLTVYVFNKILNEINITNKESHIATLFFAFSFSNILFAIVTETYAVSCFLISCLFLYYFKCKNNGIFESKWIWLMIATLLTGITITNVGIFFIIYVAYLTYEKKYNLFKSFKFSSFFSTIAVAIVCLFYFLSHLLLKYPRGGEGSLKWILSYFSVSPENIKLNALNFFVSSFNAFCATTPQVIDRKLLNADPIDEYNALSFMISNNSSYLFALTFIIALFASFFYIKTQESQQWQHLCIICQLIILFNFCLHIVFGREIFMYTQHWILPLSLILTPLIIRKRLLFLFALLIMIFLNFKFIINVDLLVNYKLAAS